MHDDGKRVALPGGGGREGGTLKVIRIAIKTGRYGEESRPDGRYINKYIAYTALRLPATRALRWWW